MLTSSYFIELHVIDPKKMAFLQQERNFLAHDVSLICLSGERVKI